MVDKSNNEIWVFCDSVFSNCILPKVVFPKSATPEQIDKVRKILAEINVHMVVRNIYEKQSYSA